MFQSTNRKGSHAQRYDFQTDKADAKRGKIAFHNVRFYAMVYSVARKIRTGKLW